MACPQGRLYTFASDMTPPGGPWHGVFQRILFWDMAPVGFAWVA